MYANYATNSALFRNQYGASRANNTHHPQHNTTAEAVTNQHYQNSVAGAAMGYPPSAAAVTNSSSTSVGTSHWNPVDSAAPPPTSAVPTFSADYAATASHPQ